MSWATPPGLELDLLAFGLLALGDDELDPVPADAAVLQALGGGDEGRPADLAGGPLDPGLGLEGGQGADRFGFLFQQGVDVIFMDPVIDQTGVGHGGRGRHPVQLFHRIAQEGEFPVARPVDDDLVEHPVDEIVADGLDAHLGGAQLPGALAHVAPERPDPEQEQAEHPGGTRRDLGRDGEFLPGDEGRAVPAPLDVPVVALGDGVEAALDRSQQGGVALAHRPVQFAAVQRLGGPELVLDAHLDQVIQRRGPVDGEDLEPAVPGGRHDVLVIIEKFEVRYPVGLQDGDRVVPPLGADDEAGQIPGAPDARQFRAEEDGDVDAGVGRAEIIEGPALFAGEDGVDDVILARSHALLGLVPVHAVEPDFDAGLLLPERPLVHQDALEPPIGRPEGVGRVDIVQHHPDGRPRDLRLRGASEGAEGAQDKNKGQHEAGGGKAGW
jgi:hypothetical protein